MNITFEIESALSVTSRDVELVTDLASIPAEMLPRVFAYGWSQVIADAASGAVADALTGKFGDKFDGRTKTDAMRAWLESADGTAAVAESTLTLMSKKRDAILAGEWSSRGNGGLGIRGQAILRLFKPLLDKAQTKAFNKLGYADQVTKAVANAEANPDFFTESAIADAIATIEAERKAREERKAADAKAREALAGKVTINI